MKRKTQLLVELGKAESARRAEPKYKKRGSRFSYIKAESLVKVSACFPKFFHDGILSEVNALKLIEHFKTLKTAMPVGPTWSFEPFPLWEVEVRKIQKRRRFHRLRFTKYGDYEVAPFRSSLRFIDSIFWAAREIRKYLTLSPRGSIPDNVLDEIRRITLKELRPVSGQVSSLMKKILSSIYVHKRTCSKIQRIESAKL